jgi:hypothetical protein
MGRRMNFLLSAHEAAAFLKADTGWIYKHMNEFPVTRIGKYRRFKKSAPLRYIKRSST